MKLHGAEQQGIVWRACPAQVPETIQRKRQFVQCIDIIRLDVERLLEQINRFPYVVQEPSSRHAKSHQVVGFEEQQERLRIDALASRYLANQLHPELINDLARNFILDGKYVVELPVPGFRPDLGVGRSVNQLHGHANCVTRLAHRALQYVSHTQFCGNRRDVLVGVLVLEGRGSRDDPQFPDAGEQVQHFFADAVGEELLFGIGAEVDERQNCN